MQTSDVTTERLQRLATLQAPEPARVLSLYLNLDPSANLAARANRRSAVNSLLDEAHRAVEGLHDLTHEAHVALRADVDRARDALEANLDDGWAEGAHGLAMFVSGPADLFDVVRLPRPVHQQVVIDERPAIEPLAETGPVEPWAVLLTDGDDARLLEGVGDRLTKVEDASSDHSGRTSRASQSAQRYDGPIGQEERAFLGEVAKLLRQADERRDYRRVLVGTTERHFSVLQDALPPALRAKIIGRFDAGADWEGVQSIRAKVEPLLQADETQLERAALERMGARGVRGLADTLPALYERRVGTLLLEPGLEHRGVVCPRCRWAAVDELDTCPIDGEQMRPLQNVVEWAVELAIEQDATVRPLRHHNDLEDAEGIGAALRF